MLTCKSPRKVMRSAWHLAAQSLPDHTSKYSRKDGFTLPQLFACVTVKELLKRSYREAEALLRDCEHWCKDLGMPRVPDHNTLCRADGRGRTDVKIYEQSVGEQTIEQHYRAEDLMVAFDRKPKDAATIRRCVEEGDRYVHEFMLGRRDLAESALKLLSVRGANKVIRDAAAKRLRG